MKLSCTTSELLIAAFIDPENKPITKKDRLRLFSHFIDCDRCCLTFAWMLLDTSDSPLNTPFFEELFQPSRRK